MAGFSHAASSCMYAATGPVGWGHVIVAGLYHGGRPFLWPSGVVCTYSAEIECHTVSCTIY
jgi:hypothetical protein